MEDGGVGAFINICKRHAVPPKPLRRKALLQTACRGFGVLSVSL